MRISFLRVKHMNAKELQLTNQKTLTETLLKNILPVSIVEKMQSGQLELSNSFQRYPNSTVLFADIAGFTKWSSTLDAERVGIILHRLISLLDARCGELKCEKIKTVGDAYWIVAGIPDVVPVEDLVYRIGEFALSMPKIMSKVNEKFGTHLEQRIGVHCGPLFAGIIGRKKFSYDVWGTTMDRCIELEAGGVGNKVHVSEEFKNLLEMTTNCKLMYRCVPANLHTEDQTYFFDNDFEDEIVTDAPAVIEAKSKPKPVVQRKYTVVEPLGEGFQWGDFVVESQVTPAKAAVINAVQEFQWGDFNVESIQETAKPITTKPQRGKDKGEGKDKTVVVFRTPAEQKLEIRMTVEPERSHQYKSTFSFGDFDVEAVPIVNKPKTLTDDLLLRGRNQFKSEKPVTKDLDSLSGSSLSEAASGSDDEENTCGPPMASTPSVFECIQSLPNAHKISWTLKFLNNLEESVYLGSRIVSKREIRSCAIFSFINCVSFLIIWLVFTRHFTDAVSIILYIVTAVSICVCILQEILTIPAMGVVIVPLLNFVCTFTGYFSAFYGLSFESNAAMNSLKNFSFGLVLLLILMTTRRWSCWYGISCSAVFTQSNMLCQIFTFMSPPGRDIVICQVLFCALAFSMYHRENIERVLFTTAIMESCETSKLERERLATDVLLGNVLPATVAQQLRASATTFILERKENCTVLFAEILNLNEMMSSLENEDEHDMELAQTLNELFSLYDDLCDVHGVEKIKSIGSAYLAVSGAPIANPNHVSVIFSLAVHILNATEKKLKRWPQLKCRIGINTGSLVAGVLGTKKFAYDIFGDTVNTASRLMTNCDGDDIQASTTTYTQLPKHAIENYLWEKNTVTMKGKGVCQTYVLHKLSKRSRVDKKAFRDQRDGERMQPKEDVEDV
eukprot:PhF_6_TR29429/c0_g1_i2/m.43563